MKAKHLICNPIQLAALSLSIFLSASPLWANQVQCKGVHSAGSASTLERMQATLAKVPRDDYGLTPERWNSFQASMDSIFQTNESMHRFLWKFSQTVHHLKGVARANPSKAAMQELREGRPMPDQLKELNEIESAVLSFLMRFPEQVPPPTALVTNYRALVILANESTPQELSVLKNVFAANPPANPLDPVWSANFMQALDSIQKRLGHRILQ